MKLLKVDKTFLEIYHQNNKDCDSCHCRGILYDNLIVAFYVVDGVVVAGVVVVVVAVIAVVVVVVVIVKLPVTWG